MLQASRQAPFVHRLCKSLLRVSGTLFGTFMLDLLSVWRPNLL